MSPFDDGWPGVTEARASFDPWRDSIAAIDPGLATRGIVIHTTRVPVSPSQLQGYWATPQNIARLLNDPMAGRQRVSFRADHNLRPGDPVSVKSDGSVGSALPARGIVGIVQNVSYDSGDPDGRPMATVWVNPPYARAQQAHINVEAFYGQRFDQMIVDDPFGTWPTQHVRRPKYKRINMAEGLDDLVRDLGGLRTITGVLNVRDQRADHAPVGCSRHGALLVKIDDVVYCFSLGYNDPLHREKQKQLWLANETGRTIPIDGVLNKPTQEALLDAGLHWSDVPMMEETEPFLVVDVAEADDAVLVDSLEEVFPPLIVEVRGRCTCHPRVDGCVDILYATDENKSENQVVFEVGVGDAPLVGASFNSFSADRRFVHKWFNPQGAPMWEPSSVAEARVECRYQQSNGEPRCTFRGYARSTWTCPKCDTANDLRASEVLDYQTPEVVELVDAVKRMPRLDALTAITAARRMLIVEPARVGGDRQIRILDLVESFARIPS